MQTTSLLSCKGMSQESRCPSKIKAQCFTFLIRPVIDMQLPPGTPTLPETFSNLTLSNIEKQDSSQATTRPQAVPARWLLISVGVPYNREELKQSFICHTCGAKFRHHSQWKIATFFPIKKVKKLLFFRDNYNLWESMTHIRILLKHLCLA